MHFLNVSEQMQHWILFRCINILVHFRGGTVSWRRLDLNWSQAEGKEKVGHNQPPTSSSWGETELQQLAEPFGSLLLVAWIFSCFYSGGKMGWPLLLCLLVQWWFREIVADKSAPILSLEELCCRSRHIRNGGKRSARKGRWTLWIIESMGSLNRDSSGYFLKCPPWAQIYF